MAGPVTSVQDSNIQTGRAKRNAACWLLTAAHTISLLLLIGKDTPQNETWHFLTECLGVLAKAVFNINIHNMAERFDTFIKT